MELLKTAVLASALLSTGVSLTSAFQQPSTPTCQLPYGIEANGKPVTTYVENCTSQLQNGEHCQYEDGTDCRKLGIGHDKEATLKVGKCENGDCALTPIPFGCNGTTRSVDTKNPQIGCTYTCTSDKGQLAYGYHTVGTVCQHVLGTSLVRATCKAFGNEVLCRQTPEAIPKC
uniref:Putative conserved secreted protein n=1 Tax=Amblyomma tuberculatum TaxID=48802 RepID=A0A6M2E5U1_9ACAR